MGDNQTAVVYGICSKDSNSMKSQNPNSGTCKANTTRTLDCNGGNPRCNQGGMVVIEGTGSRPSHHGDGYKESDVMYTLNTVERHAVATQSFYEFKESDKGAALLSCGGILGGGGENLIIAKTAKYDED